MFVNCLSCQNYDHCDQLERWDGGCINHKLRTQTNADRIRSMTDDELARFLWQAAPYDNCPPMKCIEFETRKKPTTGECIACWGRWLKQEAER